MKIVCVGHAIKEVLSALDSLKALQTGVAEANGTVCGSFLLSDGGDGFLDVYMDSHPSAQFEQIVTLDALGADLTAPYIWDPESETAVIEVAKCRGLAQINPSRRNIMISGSAGIADLLAVVRRRGAKKVLIGLGGTATCDGGVGFLWRLAEISGQCRNGCPEIRTAMDMADIPSPDIEALRVWADPMEIIACADVDNPLLGEIGAAHSFAAQKGANVVEVEQLDAFMESWADRVERNAGEHWRDLNGAGAAGGLSFAMASIGALLVPGALACMEFNGLAEFIKKGQKVITTEGRFDFTSFHGKAPWTIASTSVTQGIDAIIFCGIAEESAAAQAAKDGVVVVEFGRHLHGDDRKSQAAACITEAVKQYLVEGMGNKE